MTTNGVLEVVERIVRKGIRPDMVESVVVREDEDWSGDPSLFVDVFLAPDAEPPDVEASMQVRRSLTQELLDRGERRFAYLRFRDRAGENDQQPSPGQT
jgi:hypothetical protein